MRIAVASSGLGHVTRGIETWAADLGRALAARGEDVRLCKAVGAAEHEYERVIPCWTRDSAAAATVRRLVPVPLAWRLGIGSGYGVEQASFAMGLLRLLRRERVDLLHVQDPLLALIAQRAGRLGLIRTRTILAHGTEESAAFQGKIRFLQHLAPWHLEEARSGGYAADSWTAIPNFIDTEVYRPGNSPDLRARLGIPPNAVVVLSVAAIKRDHKRIDHLLREFAGLLETLQGRGACLVVAGGREAGTDELIAEGSSLLGENVRFLVKYPRDRMAELYRAADVFALASLKEMMPIALLEALASGLPCITHDHPVLAWISGAGGRTVDMREPGSLADALAEWVGDPSTRRLIGHRGRIQVLNEFGQEVVVDRILTYYRFVMDTDQFARDTGGLDGPALGERRYSGLPSLEDHRPGRGKPARPGSPPR